MEPLSFSSDPSVKPLIATLGNERPFRMNSLALLAVRAGACTQSQLVVCALDLLSKYEV